MDAEKTLTPKADDAVELFERRIREGAYGLRGIPGERKLASELGVSYMSARKVVQRLIDKKVLRRAENGRLLAAGREKSAAGAKIAFLGPAFAGSHMYEWQYRLSRILDEQNAEFHPVYYTRSTDPLIFDALDADFDGIFVMVPIGASRLVLERIARERHRVVVICSDLSHMGVLSVNNSSNRFIGKLVDHLRGLGHRSVSCFNSQPENQVVTDRIQYWRNALEQRGMPGELYNYPVESFESPILGAYQRFCRMIDEGLKSTAFFCITPDMARGVVRACYEKGVQVGRDISICSISENEVARMMVPSLTVVSGVESDYFLRLGMEWIRTGGENWNRPMLVEPDDGEVMKGESTGPAPKSSQ